MEHIAKKKIDKGGGKTLEIPEKEDYCIANIKNKFHFKKQSKKYQDIFCELETGAKIC